MPQRFELTHVWKRTLAPHASDNHSTSRERLRTAFLRFRERAATLASEIPRDLPFFTVHDVAHLDALWEMIDLVAGLNYPINPTEAFVIGGAILVHDLAMSQAAFQDEFDRIKTEPIWKDTVASLQRSLLQRAPTREEVSRPSTEIERKAIRILLRELHARQATVLLTKNWSFGGTKHYLIEDAELRATFAEDIGKVAFSHHWPHEKLLDPTYIPQKTTGGPGWLPPDWTLDLVKLGCLLRTADAIQCDDRRAPSFLAALRQPDAISEQHWRFQSLLRTPYLQPGTDRIRYQSSRAFTLEEFESWWLAHDWLAMADAELRKVDALLVETGRTPLVVKGVFNTDHPTRLAMDLRTDGWEPANAEIRVKDIPKLVRALGGEQLYGDRAEVPLRELIQNAADAVRARRKLQNRDISFGQIIVRPGRDELAQQDWIEVEDNGVGMSKSLLTGPLLDFGSAFWGTSQMRQEHPGLEALGMEATGRFGIGFYSVFMWGDRVSVITRRYDKGYDETWVLEFLRGAELRPRLRKATDIEQRSLPDGGTRVRVWCDPKRQVPHTILQLERPSKLSCTWVELCEWLAPALDVSLDVELSGSHHSAVVADDWKTLDVESLLLRINRRNSREGAIASIQKHKDFWGTATSFLSFVKDKSGRPVARCTVWNPEEMPMGFAGSFDISCTVCGGLRAHSGGRFLGIHFADPETAARNRVKALPSESGWQEWAEEQMQIDGQMQFPVKMRAISAIKLSAFIHPKMLPFGMTKQGWLTLNEIAELIRDVSSFRCIASCEWAAKQLLEESTDMLTILILGDFDFDFSRFEEKISSVSNLLRETAAVQWGVECIATNASVKLEHMQGHFVHVERVTFLRK